MYLVLAVNEYIVETRMIDRSGGAESMIQGRVGVYLTPTLAAFVDGWTDTINP